MHLLYNTLGNCFHLCPSSFFWRPRCWFTIAQQWLCRDYCLAITFITDIFCSMETVFICDTIQWLEQRWKKYKANLLFQLSVHLGVKYIWWHAWYHALFWCCSRWGFIRHNYFAKSKNVIRNTTNCAAMITIPTLHVTDVLMYLRSSPPYKSGANHITINVYSFLCL